MRTPALLRLTVDLLLPDLLRPSDYPNLPASVLSVRSRMEADARGVRTERIEFFSQVYSRTVDGSPIRFRRCRQVGAALDPQLDLLRLLVTKL
jgi:hypothetical protein